MKRTANLSNVERQFKGLLKAMQGSLNSLNQEAASYLARGEYARAEALASRGKEIQAYVSEMEGHLNRWRALARSEKPTPRAARKTRTEAPTPLWGYYKPILSSLENLGGSSVRKELEDEVKRVIESELKPIDRDLMHRGQERWQLMVRRSKRAMVEEGWLEPNAGHKWVLTAAGRRIVKKNEAMGPE